VKYTRVYCERHAGRSQGVFGRNGVGRKSPLTMKRHTFRLTVPAIDEACQFRE
jgi:hypothetical protein